MTVSLSLATAPMSPAANSPAALCSLPWSSRSWPRRSLPCVRELTSVESALTVPERTRKTVIRPANGSATVLKTKAAVPSDASSLLSTGDGTPSTSRSSKPVVPRFLRGDAAEDGEELATRDSGLERRGQLVAADLLPLEVALHDALVGLDDGLDQRLTSRLGRLVGELRRDVGRSALLAHRPALR